MISALFCVMVSSSYPRPEVSVELARIRDGERPADGEVKREWDAMIGETRSRWAALCEQIDRRRGETEPPLPGSRCRGTTPRIQTHREGRWRLPSDRG
jgi:hypothetical protein